MVPSIEIGYARAGEMSRLLPLVVGTLVVLAALAWNDALWADEPANVAAARELFVEGSELSKQGDWEGARDRFERSMALKPAPITIYSLAVAQMNTGRLAESLEGFRAFLAEPAEPATEPYVEPARAAVAELEGRVSYIKLVIVPAGLPGLAVRVDNVEVPPAALTIPRLVNPGTHVVTAIAPGRRAAQREITLSEGQTGVAELTLAADAAVEPDPEPAHGSGADDDTSQVPVLPIVLMAVGGAAVVAGVAVGLVGLSEANDAPTRDGPEADAARAKSLAGDVVAVVGGATAVLGLVLLFVLDGDDDTASQRVTPAADGSVGVRVRF
jgi:hypothetical protein